MNGLGRTPTPSSSRRPTRTRRPDGGIAFTNAGNDGVSEHSMVIRGDGRIGMGTKSPEVGTKLHVSGDIKQTAAT